MIDHVIFDLDGTLIDSAATCCNILDDMLRDRGHDWQVCRAKARDFVSAGGTAMVAGLLDAACRDPAVEIAEFRERYAARATPPDSLFVGVRDGLEALRAQGYTLAICSNKPQILCEKVLADLGLTDLFAVVTGRSGVLRAKPATDLMDATLRDLGVAAERCVFVGDSELDHMLAVTCDMPFLYVTYGYGRHSAITEDVRRHDAFAGVVLDILANKVVAPPAWPSQATARG